jgi:hypothetical protein
MTSDVDSKSDVGVTVDVEVPSEPTLPGPPLLPSPPVSIGPQAEGISVVVKFGKQPRLWFAAFAFASLAFGVIGYSCGRQVARESSSPSFSTSTLPPINVQAAVASSKGDEERYKRMERQMERLEDRLNLQSDMLGDLVQSTHLHTHRGPEGLPQGPYRDAGAGILLVPVVPRTPATPQFQPHPHTP